MPDLPNAQSVAKYFIWKSNQEGKQITNKKLQKLLYYAQAWSLVLKNRPLFKDKIEAWIHGPTIPGVYHFYKKYGFDPIKEKVTEAEIKQIPERDVLDAVWDAYGRKYDADYLEILTHNEEPWQKAREGISLNVSSSAEITLDSMQDFYKSFLPA